MRGLWVSWIDKNQVQSYCWNYCGNLKVVCILDNNDNIGSDSLVDLIELWLGRKLFSSLRNL